MASGRAMRGLVGFDRERGLDPTPSQVSTVGPRRIRLIGKDAIRAGSGTTDPETRHPDLAEHGRELRAVRPLTGRDHECQRALVLVSGQMSFVVNPPRDRPSP
jgi:hypothetical protein